MADATDEKKTEGQTDKSERARGAKNGAKTSPKAWCIFILRLTTPSSRSRITKATSSCRARGDGLQGIAHRNALRSPATADSAAKKAMDTVTSVQIFVRGPGPGENRRCAPSSQRDQHQLDQDVTPIPHNGCRPPKRRRV